MAVRKLVTAFEMRYNAGGMETPNKTDVVSKTMATFSPESPSLSNADHAKHCSC
jgi:hypothetical protein